MAQGVLDCRQRFADTSVVRDSAVLEWNVEIDPHEDAVIVQRKIANRKLRHGLPLLVIGLLTFRGNTERKSPRVPSS